MLFFHIEVYNYKILEYRLKILKKYNEKNMCQKLIYVNKNDNLEIIGEDICKYIKQKKKNKNKNQNKNKNKNKNKKQKNKRKQKNKIKIKEQNKKYK